MKKGSQMQQLMLQAGLLRSAGWHGIREEEEKFAMACSE